MNIYEKSCLCGSPLISPSSCDALHHPHHQKVAVTPWVSKPTERTWGMGFLPGKVGKVIPLPGLLPWL